jgi:DNA repair photolyase
MGMRRRNPMEEPIKTTPVRTEDGKPFDFYIQEQVRRGELRLQRVPKEILGTPRDLEVYRAKRKTNFIVDWVNSASDKDYCCEYWADLKIGRGPCGYRCADCFLILTHRVKADPSRHILFENTGGFVNAVKAWLLKRTNRTSLGLGIDCSDSLFYEGVTGYAKQLIPLFADSETNPFGRHLVLLTKSANVHYLEGLPTSNVVVSFSLNPQKIADLFEGRFPDGLRITPSIDERLNASGKCERMGFETRWRVDPIIPVEGWQGIYREFFENSSGFGPKRITLGIYRQMGSGLKVFSQKWGLQPMSWQPSGKLVKDMGSHLQLPRSERVEIYGAIRGMVEAAWPQDRRPELSLCKEVGGVRAASDIPSRHCNCE